MKPTTRAGVGIVFFFAALLAAKPGHAIEVRGTLEVSPGWLAALDQRTSGQPDEGPPTRYWEVGNGAASIDPPVITLGEEFGILIRRTDSIPLDPLSTEEPVVDVQDMAFQPAVSFVREGMSLKVRNLDLFDHDFVVEPEKGGPELPKEDLDGGRSFRVRFNASGLYVLRCREFPFLRGYVLVDKSPVRFVRPADDGTFSFGDLPPGPYTLAVFNATAQASSAPTPAAGWVASPCPLDVPTAAPAAPAPAAPPPDEHHRPAEAEAPAAPATPAPATPALVVTVKLEAQGSTERIECPAGFPPPPAPGGTPAAPAQPAAGGGPR